MKSKFLCMALLCLCTMSVRAQFEPYFGSGSTSLNVSSGAVHYANETRARGVSQNTGSGITHTISYDNLENGPFDPNAWFLIIATEVNPYTHAKVNHYFTKATAGIFTTSATAGRIEVQFLPPANANQIQDFQVIQVDEYNSALIEGKLTVDAYDPVKGHGGVLCMLIEGNLNMGTDGVVDVSECGFNGSNGGAGGTAGVVSGAGAAAPTSLNQVGNDATLGANTYSSFTTGGEKIVNIDLTCATSGELEGKKGGMGTVRIFGSDGSNATAPFVPVQDEYNDTLLTMGGGGRGGNGGRQGASAGGNGGSGATNGLHSGYLDNTYAGAGPGGTGTGPIPATGFSDGDAGDGGDGGPGGGVIYIRARTYTCQPNTQHFIANGGDGVDGEDGHGGGGIGGHGGKGSDGGCSEDANGGNPYIYAAGGNGAVGKGGNGADGGSGGNGGSSGTIWLLYDVNMSGAPAQSNCTESHGLGGSRGEGGAAGANGTRYRAQRRSGNGCYCGGAPEVQYKAEGNECACFENFKKLKDMDADGLTTDGFKKWTDPVTGDYCYYDDVEDKLICQSINNLGSPTHTVVTRTTQCGEFDCPWVADIFDDTHSEDAEIVLEDGQAKWTLGGIDHTFTFSSGVISDGSNNCLKGCDPQDEQISNATDAPSPGIPGSEGKAPEGPTGPATIIGISDGFPPMGVTTPEWDFALYPNPAENILYLRGLEATEWSYEIVNTSGQSLLQGQGSSTNSTISIAQLPKGTYFVRLSVNGQQRVQSFEKQ